MNATTHATARIDDEPAFVLHTYPYRETSVIVEAWSANHGRVALIARGAKRGRSELRGTLQAFQPLALGWMGSRELKTLIRAEWLGGMPLPAGSALLCAFYLNELLLKLLPREDSHPALYADYAAALGALAEGAEQAPLLRRFELALLQAIGYALNLTHDVDQGAPIDANTRYHFLIEKGASRSPARNDQPGFGVQGSTLLALASADFSDVAAAAEAKRLMRVVLDHHLEARRLFSRRIMMDLQSLDEAEQA
ncbi:MAG: DNA repair protein RecO [Casimicrobiaceae bacterium]